MNLFSAPIPKPRLLSQQSGLSVISAFSIRR
nr:MAG TPA: hypothetical protein [Caudoviricetes sp.]